MNTLRHLKWSDLGWEQMNPLLDRQFISTAGLTVARFALKKGCVVPRHQHENEQVAMVLEGALKFGMDDREVVVRAGEALCIPPNLPHSAEALEDTRVMDIFAPPRADWARQADAYLREKK
ncbi:MAG TPA: cupin domain-containing protein [Terriglobales bacterium]|jgi:quercetin dioxygenase-like cupin family protein|nr:cupin domain-containing protein [Terriglobales bacterium]